MKRVSVGADPFQVDTDGWDQVTVYAEGGAIRASYAPDKAQAKVHYRPIPSGGEAMFEVGAGGPGKCSRNGLFLFTSGQTIDAVLTWECVSRRVRQ